MGLDSGKNDKNVEIISKINKKLFRSTYIRSLTREEVLAYIGRLHKIVRKQEKKLRKYKLKIKLLNRSTTSKVEDRGSIELKLDAEKPQNFIDDIREAAEEIQNKNGFIYEPTSGLYYDQKTGYYYNAEYGLYYDGNSGCYYHYDQEKNEFHFHSQVLIPSNEGNKAEKCTQIERNDEEIGDPAVKSRHRQKKLAQLNHDKEKEEEEDEEEEEEDGEIVSSSNDDADSDSKMSKYEDIAKKYPPSLRVIVQETNSPKIKVGTLHIITYKGGSLGREGDHEVLIPDVNVSKYHLKFAYNEERNVYQCVDLGSRNGTYLNGKRMSNAKQESESLDIVHGSVLQVSQTKLLCHIHTGNSTCGHCEPGLLMQQPDTQKVLTLTHREQLKSLQKRYGLENEKYIQPKSDSQYNNRAATRREQIGSSSNYEKTQTASTASEITSENKGFKMLSKLGWHKGQTLGKNNNGLLEPIPLVNNEGTKGLGCVEPTKIELSISEVRKKTQARYAKIHNNNT